MAPRGQTLPQATTESAREARKSFFCELCQKGYARTNEFEAHQGSYDHQHRKRLLDMKKLTKDPSAAARARAAEERQDAGGRLKPVALPSGGSGAAAAGGGGGVKKKPVFKSTLQPQNAALMPPAAKKPPDVGDPDVAYDDWQPWAYDPHFPTKYIPYDDLPDDFFKHIPRVTPRGKDCNQSAQPDFRP